MAASGHPAFFRIVPMAIKPLDEGLDVHAKSVARHREHVRCFASSGISLSSPPRYVMHSKIRDFLRRILGAGSKSAAVITPDRLPPSAASATQNAFAELDVAKAILANGDFPAALNAFQRVVDRGAAPAEGHYGWAMAALRLGRLDDAVAAFHLALDFRHPEAGLRLAEMAHGGGDEAAALTLYGRVLEIIPQLAEARYGWGVAALGLGRVDDAAGAFNAALDLKHPEAGLRLAGIAQSRGDEAAALSLYGRVLEISPGLAEAQYGWGRAALALGRAEEAKPAFQRAMNSTLPHPEAALRLAEFAMADGQYETAIGLYRQALDCDPDLAEAHYGLGIAVLAMGQAAEAQEAFGRAIVAKPNYPAAVAAAALLSLFPPQASEKPPKALRPLICVPVLPFLTGWLGGQIYLLNFARTMSVLPRSRQPRLLVVVVIKNWQNIASLREMVDALLACEAVVGVFDEAGTPVSSKPILDRYARARQAKIGDRLHWTRDLFAEVSWTFPVLYPSWGVASLRRPIFWIPDFQHRFWPSYFSADELAARERDIAALATRRASVIFSSADARAHFESFYPAHRASSHVWHFHTVPDPSSTASDSLGFAALNLPKRYYYTPNQFWPHKNHATLFHGLRRLLNDGHDVTFICTGNEISSKPDQYQSTLLSLIDELDIGRNLRLLGVLPRVLQLELLRRACAIIQPSLFEGWSTVIEDARLFGRPLIVSDIPVHREQADGRAIFFSAEDPESLAAAVASVDVSLTPGPDDKSEMAALREMKTYVDQSAEAFLAVLADSTQARRKEPGRAI